MSQLGRDPLSDTLFRPTTAEALAIERAAAPPRHDVDATPDPPPTPPRVRGTRVRAGNAMNRTRVAVLAGAARAVAEDGTRITMSQVAVEAGVAKATLYNHFRTRETVLAALLADQVAAVAAVAAAHRRRSLPDALAATALHISAHPLRRALADREPATLAALAVIDDAAAGWRAARVAVEEVLAADGRAGTDTVLRWLASFLLSPGDPATVADDVAVLVTGLPLATPEARAASHQHRGIARAG